MPHPVQGRSLASQAAHQAGQQLREGFRQLLPFQPTPMPAHEARWTCVPQSAQHFVADLIIALSVCAVLMQHCC